MLSTPSLLMKKQFVRNTDTKQQVLNIGEAFQEIPQ